MTNKNNILKNIFSSLFQQLIKLIYGLIVPILIIRNYGSEVNGLISSITQFVSYIALLEFGIGPIIKFSFFKPLLAKDEKEIGKILGTASKFFKKIAYIYIIYLIFLCLIYPNFINEFDFLYTFSLIIIISFSKFFEYFIGMTYSLFLQSDQKNYVIDYTITITYILNIIVVVILIKLHCNIHLLELVTSLIYIIRPIVLKIYFRKRYNYKKINDKNYKLKQQYDGLFHHIAYVVQSNTDVAILTIFSTLKNVSIYSVYNLIIIGVRAFIVSLTNGIDAFFGKLFINDNQENIKRKFELYTFFFYTITTIFLSVTLVLIIPFINIYTSDINDANYIKEIFAYILVFAEFSYIIRLPYSNIVYAKGHFKQTRNFSIVEPIINIILSILFVVKYGLIGVAIGTLVSMLIRSIGFIVYGSKNILNVKVTHSIKIIIISYLEMLSILVVRIFIGWINVSNYFNWFILAFMVFIIISIIIFSINCLVFKDVFKQALKIIFKRVKTAK